MDGVLVNDDQNEPTMGEKLAHLNLIDDNKPKTDEIRESSPAKPPSADSVHVLLKQALHADDRALLLECLYNQDKKVFSYLLTVSTMNHVIVAGLCKKLIVNYNLFLQVITKSVSMLKPSDVLKLLHSLVSIIQSR